MPSGNTATESELTQYSGGNTLSIVVIEDDELLRVLAGDAFAQRQFYVVETADALEALHVLEADACNIDAVFAEICMPGHMNGLLLARHVRGRWPWIKVVLTSGQLTPIDLPANIHFIAKPYRITDVVTEFLVSLHS